MAPSASLSPPLHSSTSLLQHRLQPSTSSAKSSSSSFSSETSPFSSSSRTLTDDRHTALLVIGGALLAAAVVLLLVVAALCWRHQKRRRQRPRHHSDKEQQPLKQSRVAAVRPDHPAAFALPTISVSETGSEPISSDVSCLSQSSSSSSLAAFYSLSPLSSLTTGSVAEETCASEATAGLGDGGVIGIRAVLDAERRQLTVRVLAAKRLPAAIRKGTADAYVKLCVLPEKRERYTTRVVRNSVDPVFNEQFVFALKPCISSPAQLLRLIVCDFDKFSRRAVMGTAVLPVSHLATLGTGGAASGGVVSAEVWLPLEERGGDSQQPKERVRGAIEVSLCHVGATRLINIAVLRARDLVIREGETVAVYVKMTWFDKRRATRMRKSRHARAEGREWQFGDRMSVPLSDSSQLTNACLVLAVCARNRHGGRYTVGRCCIGSVAYSAGTTGVQHWNGVLHSPDQTVVMWHDLL